MQIADIRVLFRLPVDERDPIGSSRGSRDGASCGALALSVSTLRAS
jgi:hypothetical protein